MRRLFSFTLLGLTGILLGTMPLSSVAAGKTLRVATSADLKTLDPLLNTTYVTRNHGYMIYDTLFSVDAQNVPRPQMVESYRVSADGKQWEFVLRKQMKFHDGVAVKAADCVESIKRWEKRDALGKMLMDDTVKLETHSEASFTLTLREAFPVLEAFGRPSAYPLFVYPLRMATQDVNQPIRDMTGSGPFIFKQDEWRPGSKVVYVRNKDYVPRSEPPSGLAGGKVARVDRVEWFYMPDSNTAIAALKNNEVDLLDSVPADKLTELKSDAHIRLINDGSAQGIIAFNYLHPPFNQPKARQALMLAVRQQDYMAVAGESSAHGNSYCGSFFGCGHVNESQLGSEPYRDVGTDYRQRLARARQLLQESGYHGEKIVVLYATDAGSAAAATLLVAQNLKDIGANVDLQSSDWATLSVQRLKKDAPDKGGWNIYLTSAGLYDVSSPMVNPWISASCAGSALPGWPCNADVEKLRGLWLKETDTAKRRSLLDKINQLAFQQAIYIPFGQFAGNLAARADLKNLDLFASGIPVFWNLDK